MTNPEHIDAEFAASTRYHGVIAHGMWGAALISAVLGTRTLSRPTSRVRVAVEPTNEEWMAARQALATLRGADATMPSSNRAFY